MPIKIKLKDILYHRDMSQTELMRRSGLSMGTINALVNGRATGMTLETLERLCKTLEIEPSELVVISDNDH